MTEAPKEIKILLVDDEADFLEAMRPGLVRRGFLVTTAESGQTALDLLSSETFDVIVVLEPSSFYLCPALPLIVAMFSHCGSRSSLAT